MARLLTTAEVADKLNLSTWTVRKLVQTGRLPWVRLTAGKLLFDQEQVESAIQKHGSGPAANIEHR
jgi:excisionase family DNA binding protein